MSVGNPTPYTDGSGAVWSTDSGCDNTQSTTFNHSSAAITGTADPTLYRFGRQGQTFNCTYTTTPYTYYTITLKFSNTFGYTRGQQVQNVFVNGVNYLPNLDVAGGSQQPNTAYDAVIGPVPVSLNSITLTFAHVTSQPAFIDAIFITPSGIGGGGVTNPGGAFGAIQYNNGGFGGIPMFTFDGISTVGMTSAGILDLHSVATNNVRLPGGLTTGLVKVTTVTGNISTAIPAIDYIPPTQGSAIQKASLGGLTAAGVTDVTSLFGGCSSGSPLLRFDGVCGSGGTGGSVPGGAAGTLQYNTGGAAPTLGGATPFVFDGTNTLTVGGSGVLDMHAMSSANLKFPGNFTTGLVKVTNSTGALSTAVASTDYIGPTSGASIQRASSGGLAPAVSTDVASLFTSCSGTQYLGCDGLPHTPPSAGTGTAGSYQLIPSSGSPNFPCGSNTVDFWEFVLNGPATATISGCVRGQHFGWRICQDATGSRVFTPPAGFTEAAVIPPYASVCTTQNFEWDGTNAKPLGPATFNGGPNAFGPEINFHGIPTPPSGFWQCGADSTNHAGLECRDNNAAAFYGMVLEGADINNFTGTVTKLNGGSVPTSAAVLGSNGSSQLIVATATAVDSISYAAGGGTAQVQTLTLAPAITSYTAGLSVAWLPLAANSGAAPTLNVNGLGAKAVTKYGTTALVANDITTTAVAYAIYDGTQFQLQNPQTNVAPSFPANANYIGTSGSAPVTATVVHNYGCAVGDPNASSALATGLLCYVVAPQSCTIVAWDIVVDAGTATVDVWKIATGTAHPTVANTITASATPAISSGTAIHSTTLTGWTTSVAANDIFAFNLNSAATVKVLTASVSCSR